MDVLFNFAMLIKKSQTFGKIQESRTKLFKIWKWKQNKKKMQAEWILEIKNSEFEQELQMQASSTEYMLWKKESQA